MSYEYFDFHINGTIAALLPLAMCWIGFIGYKLLKLATIKFWEIIALLPFCCIPVFATFYVANLSSLWVWGLICSGWVGLVLLENNNKNVGSFSHEGLLRILGVGEKKGVLVKTNQDLENIDILILSETDYSKLENVKDTKFQDLIVYALKLDIEILPVSTFIENQYGYVDLQGRKEIEQVGFKRRRVLRGTKRFVDVIMTILAMPIVGPVMIIISLLLLTSQGRPIFFKQQRLGKGGRLFEIFKFRTMEKNSENENIITSLGTVLRQTHLDELPQLFNVLRGDMAIVGPRPEWVLLSTPEAAPNDYWLRQAIRPGLTGWAQVIYRPSLTKKMRQRKLGYDLYYVHNRSLLLDILIWFRTFFKVTEFIVSVFLNRLRGITT